MRTSLAVLFVFMMGCSESGAGEGFNGVASGECTAGQTRACTCAGGSPGIQRCETQWGACGECTTPAGSGGTGGVDNPVTETPAIDAGTVSNPAQNASCKPG